MTKSEDEEALDAALAILSLVTGEEDWDRTKLVKRSGQMREEAVRIMRKKGLTQEDADTFVDERWRRMAAPAEELVPNQTSQTDPVAPKVANLEPIGNVPSKEELKNRMKAHRLRRKEETPVPSQEPGSDQA